MVYSLETFPGTSVRLVLPPAKSSLACQGLPRTLRTVTETRREGVRLSTDNLCVGGDDWGLGKANHNLAREAMCDCHHPVPAGQKYSGWCLRRIVVTYLYRQSILCCLTFLFHHLLQWREGKQTFETLMKELTVFLQGQRWFEFAGRRKREREKSCIRLSTTSK